ncbi:MAG: HAD-IIIA family hydrolase [Rhodospirillaceae bacterium]|jgi:3-deoxy-D-manno-octulosonate 8-phosphate phosphatase (KDO 8-P phosphatase)|nr:HAD-IIIA family hydrolase [Rhodospirillaceae bacterium]MBT3885287.1 HAD-IIIA family hydrolase [Rhodospirillaceae bacterium]MBT4118945.1 HAD-IIIA family hydrolase [Rhodospirillaceae bacterium]MBT4673298.1 HAD-IIIA family hydrolase [Rhodospirillaceae bacterium]MBT4719588.1 HAD-IIIA family hydrolase [Rhodospirillaceae bacterium]
MDDLLRGRLAGLKLLSLDTDGVLTDGGLYYTDAGDEMRKFNVKDGMGMQMLRRAGVEVVIITASSAPAIAHRGHRLGLEHVYLETEDKLAALVGLCDKMGIDLDQVAHMGDDVNDLPVLQAVGCPLSVQDAMPMARDAALYVTKKNGGNGAVREVCDLIISVKQSG